MIEQPNERVLGWDLLRGMCSIAVASYHLLLWQDVAALYAWGSYGVCLFFILSGASLAYSYAPALDAGEFSMPRFLWIRYVRLAPMYLLAMVLSELAHVTTHGSGWSWVRQALLNVTFLFGLADPTQSALAVGGWSLGIEAVFYLAFPLLLAAAMRRVAGAALLLGLVFLQAGWVHATAGALTGYAANAVRYHQVPAFAAYFMGGCLLGVDRRRRAAVWPGWPGLAALAVQLALIAVAAPECKGNELLGLPGLLFPVACFGLVALAGELRVSGVLATVARWMGDTTYGVYLLHPVLFCFLASLLLPSGTAARFEEWTLLTRFVFAAGVVLLAGLLAAGLVRRLERPVRAWSKRVVPAPARGGMAAGTA